MRTAALLLAAASLAAPRLAPAAPPPPAYAELKLGGYFPLAGDVNKYDSGFSGELALGYAPDPGFALEAGLGWFQTGHDALGVRRDIKVIPLNLGVRGIWPVGAFRPFAAAGLTIAFVRDEIGGASDSATSLGLFLGAGFTYDLTRTLFLGLEARYLFLPTKTFGTVTHLDGATVMAGLGVRF